MKIFLDLFANSGTMVSEDTEMRQTYIVLYRTPAPKRSKRGTDLVRFAEVTSHREARKQAAAFRRTAGPDALRPVIDGPCGRGSMSDLPLPQVRGITSPIATAEDLDLST